MTTPKSERRVGSVCPNFYTYYMGEDSLPVCNDNAINISYYISVNRDGLTYLVNTDISQYLPC